MKFSDFYSYLLSNPFYCLAILLRDEVNNWQNTTGYYVRYLFLCYWHYRLENAAIDELLEGMQNDSIDNNYWSSED